MQKRPLLCFSFFFKITHCMLKSSVLMCSMLYYFRDYLQERHYGCGFGTARTESLGRHNSCGHILRVGLSRRILGKYCHKVTDRLAPVLKTSFHQCVIQYTCSQSNSGGSVLKQSHQSYTGYMYIIHIDEKLF